MKHAKNLIMLLLILALIASSIFTAVQFLEKRNLQAKMDEYETFKSNRIDYLTEKVEEEPFDELKTIRKIEKKPKEVSSLMVGGWIPDWDYQDGITTIQNQTIVKSVSPFWYDLEAGGELKKLSGYADQTLISLMNQGSIELIPTITSFNANDLYQSIKTDEIIDKHINNIVSEVNSLGVDGIDLDYEAINRTDREKFFKFLTKLQIELTKNNKKLIFTALPKWGDDVAYIYFPETKLVQDYKRIADIVDELRLMTYEYTGRNNKYYGPNAPLTWMEDVIRYSIKVGVPREKLVLGVPTYSYDYLTNKKMPSIQYHPILKHQTIDQSAIAYYNRTIDDLKTKYTVSEDKFDDEWGESILKYNFVGNGRNENRVVVYPNDKSIEVRKKLAADYGIKGIYYWRLGDEGSLKL